MRKKIADGLIGLIILAVGVLLILRACHVIEQIAFPGWWAVAIALIGMISMVRSGINAGNVILLAVGVLLYLNANQLLKDVNIWLLIIGVVIVVIGVRVLFHRPAKHIPNTGQQESYTSVFSGSEDKVVGDFHGTNVTAVFGGVDLDLSEAVVTEDCAIKITAVFGGVDLVVPRNVHIKVSGVPIFGGYTNHVNWQVPEDAPTIYIDCVTIFGGTDILENKKKG